jgi:nucleoside-diphosphate-sugar epimerase
MAELVDAHGRELLNYAGGPATGLSAVTEVTQPRAHRLAGARPAGDIGTQALPGTMQPHTRPGRSRCTTLLQNPGRPDDRARDAACGGSDPEAARNGDTIMAQHVALVAGASGIIGNGLVEALAGRADWQTRTLATRPMAGVDSIAVDLLDAGATIEALKAAADTTHLFYAAYKPQPDFAAEVAVNGPMLENLLDGLKAAGAPLERVVLYQGAKVYGVHLGPVRAPFYEDDIRHIPPNFYYTQEDTLRRRSAAGEFDWCILRPDVVIGTVAGNAMNMAMVIGVFAAFCKATRTPFRFPGSGTVYDGVLAQFTDARLLGRASLWGATAAEARNEAFNYVHEPFRWERIWRQVGEGLGLEVGPPLKMTLARQMADKAPLWAQLTQQHGLREMPYERLVGWDFGDFIFNTEFDMISDMGKIRRAGFNETVDSGAALLAAIRSLQDQKVLPPFDVPTAAPGSSSRT